MSIPLPGWPLCLRVEEGSARPGMGATCSRPASKEDGDMGSHTTHSSCKTKEQKNTQEKKTTKMLLRAFLKSGTTGYFLSSFLSFNVSVPSLFLGFS